MQSKSLIGFPSKTTISASLPASMLPILWERPTISAGFIVIAFRASISSKPALCARPAQSGRCCNGITGESVVMATFIPASTKIFGVSKDLFLVQTLTCFQKLDQLWQVFLPLPTHLLLNDLLYNGLR